MVNLRSKQIRKKIKITFFNYNLESNSLFCKTCLSNWDHILCIFSAIVAHRA